MNGSWKFPQIRWIKRRDTALSKQADMESAASTCNHWANTEDCPCRLASHFAEILEPG